MGGSPKRVAKVCAPICLPTSSKASATHTLRQHLSSGRPKDDAQPQFGNQAPPLTTTMQLLDAVWRVRNNLFHGNKMYPADRARDADLMDNALAVIDAIMQRMQNLSSAFHDPQQYF